MIRLPPSLSIVAIGLAAGLAAADTTPVYVNAAATGASNGSSWQDAYTSLQSALEAAPTIGEIWVAQGTYYPSVAIMFRPTFRLRSGVALYGGFDGSESTRDQRDWAAHPTILSGDLGRNDPASFSDNTFHVVTDDPGSDATAILDGFTVRAGGGVFYPTQPQPGGGGFWLINSHATIRNCIISNRLTAGSSSMEAGPGAPGAGAYISGGAPTFANCTFTENIAGNGIIGGCRFGSPWPGDRYGGSGGAVYSVDNASPDFIACRFINNAAGNGGSATTCLANGLGGGAGGSGGAVYALTGDLTFTDCLFQSNSAGTGGSSGSSSAGSLIGGSAGVGGAIAARDATLVLTHCTFENNRTFNGPSGGCTAFGPPIAGGGSGGHGGGLALFTSTATIDGCRFFGNRTGNGGAGASCAVGTPTMAAGNGGSGPAIYVQGGAALVVSSAFSGQRTGAGGPAVTGPAGTAAAGVPGIDTAQGTIINGTFVANTNALGANLDVGHYGNTNSIIWTPGDPGTPIDPRFVDTDGLDNILGTVDDDFRLRFVSPFIDAGSNALVPAGFTLDAAAQPRFVDIPTVPDTGTGAPPIIDWGAFEAQLCPADFNHSGAVTVQDIFDFLAAYFSLDPRADFNGQDGISVQDIFDFLAAYFGTCP